MTREFDPLPLFAWRAEYGQFPADYLAVDTETTGIDPERDFILQLGWCRVKGGKSVLSAGVVIDWTAVMAPAEIHLLAARMENTRGRMEHKNKAYPWTVELLKARGVPPAEAVKQFLAAGGTDPAYVTHYGWQLDYPLLGRFAARWGPGLDVSVDRMFDTGLLVKACLISLSPERGENPVNYFRRVSAVRNSPRHNLEACVDRFGLGEAGVAKRHQHANSDYDAWVCHLLFEKLRAYVPERTK